jgi:hypothetical protein
MSIDLVVIAELGSVLTLVAIALSSSGVLILDVGIVTEPILPSGI